MFTKRFLRKAFVCVLWIYSTPEKDGWIKHKKVEKQQFAGLNLRS